MQKTTCRFYIYKTKKLRYVFIHKIQTLSKKQDNMRYVFIYKRQDTLRYIIFHENLKLAFLYTKAWNFAVREFFLYKISTLRKNHDNLRYVFMYKNADTLRYTIFHWIFEIGWGGEILLFAKNNALCVKKLNA